MQIAIISDLPCAYIVKNKNPQTDKLGRNAGREISNNSVKVADVVYQGNTYFYQKDIFNNITKILDANGNIIVQYVYDAWGNHAVLNANGQEIGDAAHIGNKNPFRYRSYYFDTETELYYLKSRYYDPELGRFITIDDISYLDPETINGLNLYAYCGNNPVMNVDPNGNLFITFLLISICIGAVVGGAIAGVSAYNQGARGWDLVGAIAGGAILGGGMGAIVAIGGAAGLAASGITIAGFGLSTGAAVGVSLAIGAGAGLLSYSAETLFSPSREWKWMDFAKNGISGLVKGVFTFWVAFAGGKFGVFDKLFLKDILGKELVKDIVAYDFAKGLLAEIIPNLGRTILTRICYYLEESLTKLMFVNGLGALARWIIDKILGT